MAQPKNTGFVISIASIIASIACHVYLTLVHIDLKSGSTGSSICQISDTLNCTKSLSSQFSEIAGIPLAVWGIAFNLMLLVLVLLKKFNYDRESGTTRLLYLASLASVVVSLIMLAISAFAVKSFCPICSLAYVFSATNFFGVWTWTRGETRKTMGPLPLKPLLISIAAVALGAFVLSRLVQPKPTLEQQYSQAYVDDWIAAPQQSGAPVAPVVYGNTSTDAKFKIVEFIDLLCGHCKETAPEMKQFLVRHPEVQLNIQIFSLDGECNSKIQSKVGIRCELSAMVYCAEKQQKGKTAIEWIFENQEKFFNPSQTDSLKAELITALGADSEALKTCASSDEAKKVARDQSELGNQWGVDGTPSVFVNNRKANGGRSASVLELLYKNMANTN